MRLFWLSMLVTSCTPAAGDTGKEGGDDTPDGASACANDADCLTNSICVDEACVAGDRDNDLASAKALPFDEDVESAVGPGGDVDWYEMTTTDATFVRVQTTVADGSELNTVVSLYDGDMQRIAWEDEHPSGDVGTYDSVCFGYLPGAGTWYATVESKEHFEGLGDGGRDDYTVKALLLSPNAEEDAVYDAGRSGELVADTTYSFPALAEEAGDVDYYAVDLPYADGPLRILSQANAESSEAVPEITVYNNDGDLVLHMIDPSAEQMAYLRAPLGTRYVIGVGDSLGGSGANAWSVSFFGVGEAGAGFLRGTEPDDDMARANVIDMFDQEPDIGQEYGGGGESRLETAEDEDWWAFDATFDDAYLSVYATAQYNGSLLLPRIEVYDGGGARVGEADSVLGDDAYVENLGPFAAGTYAIRVTPVADSGAEGGEGYFYALVAYATSFER